MNKFIMIKKDLFPKLDSEFSIYLNMILQYIEKNCIRLDISKSKIDVLKALKKTWDRYHTLSQHHASYSITIKDDKNDKRIEIEILLRIIYGDISEVRLTRIDRESFYYTATNSNPYQSALLFKIS